MRYVQCLNCGRMTPVDKGVCYSCGAPLPSEVSLPLGTIVCPNCLRVTSVDRGYCRRCGAPLPPDLVELAEREVRRYRVLEERRRVLSVPPRVIVLSGPRLYTGGEANALSRGYIVSSQIQVEKNRQSYSSLEPPPREPGVGGPRELIVQGSLRGPVRPRFLRVGVLG